MQPKKANRFSETRGSPSAAILGMHPQYDHSVQLIVPLPQGSVVTSLQEA